MLKSAWRLIALVFIAASVLAQESTLPSQSSMQTDEGHTRWIQSVLLSIATIKPGMTRRGIAPVLTEDGGLQTRQRGRYVYASCPYIKVDIDFSLANDKPGLSPDDKIVKVSRPYLDYPVFD